MLKAADWLTKNPQVKAKAAERLGLSREQLPDVLLADLRRTIDYAGALSESAAASGAPPDVQEQLLEFKKTVGDGIATLEKRGPFVQKTLATLAGLRDPREIKLVLKGAFPHSPTKTEGD